MSDLFEMFEKRDAAFQKMSEEIIDSLPNVIAGCKQFVRSKGSVTDNITWVDISLMEDFNMIVLIGIIKFLPGEEVTLPDGSKTVVTEDKVDYFKSMLRLGIPFVLAETGTAQEIHDFLQETIETETVTVPKTEEHVDHFQDFDMDELSEEQRKTLEMFKGYGKG